MHQHDPLLNQSCLTYGRLSSLSICLIPLRILLSDAVLVLFLIAILLNCRLEWMSQFDLEYLLQMNVHFLLVDSMSFLTLSISSNIEVSSFLSFI